MVLIPLAVLSLTACGDDDDDADRAAGEPPAATTAASTGPTATGGGAPVAVVAVDYAFHDLPASVPAGTALTLTNTSTAEVHELVAMRLPDGEERSAAEIMALPMEELEPLFAAGVTTVLVAPPGEPSFPVVGDGTLTEPGRYVIACAIPIGADPAEFLRAAQEATDGPPDVPGGPPHFTAGMFAELVVE